jgi:hypothetical protein
MRKIPKSFFKDSNAYLVTIDYYYCICNCENGSFVIGKKLMQGSQSYTYLGSLGYASINMFDATCCSVAQVAKSYN